MYIGLPQWHHSAWNSIGLHDLADYARYFNCVEGNTTFYALPKPEIVMRWRDMTHDDFRFCFKFPSTISHKAALQNCQPELDAFYQCLTPLENRIGQLWLQLPATFAPRDLDRLWQFLDALPKGFDYGVEVRNPLFFNKGEEERALNRGLHQRGINRTLLDSRPVHHATSVTEAVLEAKRKKPQLPVHAVVTATRPIVRFIGGDNLAVNQQWFTQWIKKLVDWQQQGHAPYLFIHSPDCSDAPQQAQALWRTLRQHLPALGPEPDWPEQDSLF